MSRASRRSLLRDTIETSSRLIWLGSCTQEAYCSNAIRTSKYTTLTFVPVNLFEQMHKLGNVYFVLISVLMYLGEKTDLFIGTIKAFSTIGMLGMMMCLSGIVALIDDNKRKAADQETNSQAARTLLPGRAAVIEEKQWDQVMVGDFLLVRRGEQIPADMVLLYSAGEDGRAFVSSANLDGETNLKLKAAAPLAQKVLATGPDSDEKVVLQNLEHLGSGGVEAEAPKPSIHAFEGKFTLRSESEPLSAANILLRGTLLRNTTFVIGVVVYTGSDTRMVQNSREVPLKRSNLEKVTNSVMLVVLCAQASLALFSDILYLIKKDDYEQYQHLPRPTLLLPDILSYWLTFFVLYSNLMPISLYYTLEFVNLCQSYFIRNDEKMYRQDLKFPAGVRSSNLCQEIGQVSYVFSDKTGTLTQNVMELKRIWVGGRKFGDMTRANGFSGSGTVVANAVAHDRNLKQSLDDFLEVLAVSHTCMASIDADGGMKYDGDSPDESALVAAAAELGWEFTDRRGSSATVTVKSNQTKITYEIVATNAFNSTRKRMSVLVKHNEEFSLLVKGADNVMLERARQDTANKEIEEVLQEFAVGGLRTLVIGRRKITHSDANEWLKSYGAAQLTLNDREGALDRVAEEIEKNLELVGVTGIEDKLQDNVPETIEKLRLAGIKVWVLTGDKLETAKNIGFSSKVLVAGMTVAELENADELSTWASRLSSIDRASKATMVTGAALEAILSDPVKREEFLNMSKDCAVLIACRVSPLQKAQMVELVRESVTPTPVTLAIGDGANDVPMIQEAQVGVGIAGREGRQAVMNSDFSIGQFSYLQRLLLVHGRWNYRRVCKVTTFTFWRNGVQVLCMFYFTFVSAYSGTSIFEDWIRLPFNFLCSIPIMATGCFDRDIFDATALSNPRQYVWGREGLDLNVGQMVSALASALIHSIIVFGMSWLAYPSFDALGAGDYYTYGTMMYICSVVMVNYRTLFISLTHNMFTVGTLTLSFILLCCWLAAYTTIQFLCYMLNSNMYFTAYHIVTSPPFWVLVFAMPVVGYNVDLFLLLLGRRCSSEDQQLNQLRQRDLQVASSETNPEQGSLLRRMSEKSMAHAIESGEVPNLGDDHGLDLTDFGQQKIRGCLVDSTHRCTRLCGAAAGLILLILGWYIKDKCEDVRQIRIEYAGENHEHPWGTKTEDIVKSCNGQPISTTTQCDVEVKQDLRGPIWVQYHMGPYYQNANTYLKSEVPEELRGLNALNKRDMLCKGATIADTNGGLYYPCGMKALSLFTDDFGFPDGLVSKDGIAWESDKLRFKKGGAYPRPGIHHYVTPDLMFNDLGVADLGSGVESERFIVWMKPSAGTSVTKRWGKIDGGIVNIRRLDITITNRYNVDEFKGYKQLVLTEMSVFGGRDLGLAFAILAAGGVSVVLSAASFVLSKTEPSAGVGPHGALQYT